MSMLSIPSSLIKQVKSIPRRLFGTRNDRLLKAYTRIVGPIGRIEPDLLGSFDAEFAKRSKAEGLAELPDEEREAATRKLRLELSADLAERREALQARVHVHMEPLEDWWQALQLSQRHEPYQREEYQKRTAKITEELDSEGISSEAFAILREASRRAQAHRHFDCQLIGGRVLSEGRIAEMRTGEGKTIVCHLAAFLKVVSGLKVHIITVNDYLVQRDAEFAAPIFELLGISVGFIQSQLDPGGREGLRRQAYGCDITYGTNSEFGFDYLRDNMKNSQADQVQGRLDFVIVDEVDSILIDEARTPLIISGPARDDVTRYPRADRVARELVRRQVGWDRKVKATVAKFDGNANSIPKLEDAMKILGYQGGKGGSSEGTERAAKQDAPDGTDTEDSSDQPALGPDFLTDDQVEAIQIYQHDILQMSSSEIYHRFFIVQTERKQVGITHEGVTIAQEMLDLGSLYGGANMEWPHLIENALRAHKVYKVDVDYVVQDGQIIIVDPFTGRLMHGRQWSDGLHQSIEAKENVRVKEETQTLATITIQNFIKLYLIRAGMTGTAMTEATEFDKIYKLEVVDVPTNRPVNRMDHNDKMYRNVDQKFEAIVDEIHEVHRRGRPADPFMLAELFAALKPILIDQGESTDKLDEALRQFNAAEFGDTKVLRFMLETYDELMGDLARGRPVLVGTTSVENSEKISKLLDRRYGMDHEVLNAKNHGREADIVAKAGFTAETSGKKGGQVFGNVTIATNMAGRGTDIKLGEGVVYPTCKMPDTLPAEIEASTLYPAGITKCCMNCEEYDPATNCAHCYKPKLDPRFPALGRKVCTINSPCGLHIIGTERHEARRIDNQLRGRAGRQGDPGSSRFSLSLEDDLLKMFMSDWMLKMMEKLGFSDGGSLEDKRLTKGIERAQRKVEERNFSTRKHLLEWDEPMDFQRKEFYLARQRIIEQRDLPGLIFGTIDDSIQSTVHQYLGGTFDRTCIAEWCRARLDIAINEDSINTDDLEGAKDSIRRKAKDEAFDLIRTSIGEYIDPEEPPNKWDVGGLLQSFQRQFKVALTQNQMRKMEPQEIEDMLCEAAEQHYDTVDLDGIALYLDRQYPYDALTEWAKSKFGIEVDRLSEQPGSEIADLFHAKVEEAYHRREIAYPVEACLERAFSEGTPPEATARFIVDWANHKYNVDWTLENVDGLTVDKLREELLRLGKNCAAVALEEEVEQAVQEKDKDAVVEWAEGRFGRSFDADALAKSNGDIKSILLDQGRNMLRWELTRLEQYVLLRIYDQAWKDHLLEMDHLKAAIMQRPLGGDQSHPQSQYAIEGRELFDQMWVRIANRVTDIVFKVQGGGDSDGGDGSSKSDNAVLTLSLKHADSTGAGFAGMTRDQQAAMQAQGSEGKVETIRRETPRVGRNEPCPCGSGKKYKQCHGKA